MLTLKILNNPVLAADLLNEKRTLEVGQTVSIHDEAKARVMANIYPKIFKVVPPCKRNKMMVRTEQVKTK